MAVMPLVHSMIDYATDLKWPLVYENIALFKEYRCYNRPRLPPPECTDVHRWIKE